jgi:hypothetical protein
MNGDKKVELEEQVVDGVSTVRAVEQRGGGERAAGDDGIEVRGPGYQMGDRVLVHSLARATQHNGKAGTLVEYNFETCRWTVALDPWRQGPEINVKPSNLRADLRGGAEDPSALPAAAAAGATGLLREQRDGMGAAAQEDASANQTPPPWYDENLDAEFVDSSIFDPDMWVLFDTVDKGEAPDKAM